MTFILPLADISDQNRHAVGGKGYALALLKRQGFNVPEALCITGRVYRKYLEQTGLKARIAFELNRKDFAQMRWEEIWDTALRIRNLFHNTPLPEALAAKLAPGIEKIFGNRPVAVRSSAPEEDSAAASFAGLHESFVNVTGTPAILERIKLVWASLWSDAALLYRHDTGLDPAKSVMAVVVQAFITGRQSGVCFSRSPAAAGEAVIEAVPGLNQGLVDGIVEPDRWHLRRTDGAPRAYRQAQHDRQISPAATGVQTVSLPATENAAPVLSAPQVDAVFQLALSVEALLATPVDIEWTVADGRLYLLQARPVTAQTDDPADTKRKWYLSLHRSFDNLKQLRHRIESEWLPAMDAEAEAMARIDPTALSDDALAAEVARRSAINTKWVGIYWDHFIPFAHGVRLFGQVYNDALKPEDPFEFITLLAPEKMESTARNRMLIRMAKMVQANPRLRQALQDDDEDRIGKEFKQALNRFSRRFGDLTCPVSGQGICRFDNRMIFNIVLELAAAGEPALPDEPMDTAGMEQHYLNAFSTSDRDHAAALLDLARASYRLRDDDNIYLGRIERQYFAAVQEQERRLAPPQDKTRSTPASNQKDSPKSRAGLMMQARQLVGQPAGPGLASGRARTIRKHEDLAQFKAGEVLVCDAVDPNMTFVVPLATAIVERRGGMLIHGAIIAREYGLACVTGVPNATNLIATGDLVTVDGYLGVVTITHASRT